jgi:hypothetical protein
VIGAYCATSLPRRPTFVPAQEMIHRDRGEHSDQTRFRTSPTSPYFGPTQSLLPVSRSAQRQSTEEGTHAVVKEALGVLDSR